MQFVMIGGWSCSGKSTLATELQQRLSWPLIAKDTIKERLFDSMGVGDAAWSRHLSDLAYAELFVRSVAQLRAGNACIVEANFRHDEHLAPLRALGDAAGPGLHIHCRAAPEVLYERFRGRVRHPGHLDGDDIDAARKQFVNADQRPMALGWPLLVCDTTHDWRAAVAATCDAAVRSLRLPACQ